MDVIHFTQGATDPLTTSGARGVRFVPLADGEGETHIACAHLSPGAAITTPSVTHAAALLVVHGQLTITSTRGIPANITIHAGMGSIFAPNEPYTLKSDTGAIILVVETDTIEAHERGISTPQRIAGAQWPSDNSMGIRGPVA